MVYVSAPVYVVYGCSNVDCTSVCSLQVCRQAMCLCDLFSSAYGYVHGPSYPAPLRTDIWHPALTEVDLMGKGVFFSKKNFSLDFVGNCDCDFVIFKENCDFLINKNMFFSRTNSLAS